MQESISQPSAGLGSAVPAPRPIRVNCTLRAPTAHDGLAVHRLVANCQPLDPNSVYCNLLQCTHFAATCILAETSNPAAQTAPQTASKTALLGFISAYRLPQEPQTLFVWQVAIAAGARGQGLGKRMLAALLARPVCRGIKQLQTTITADNHASRALFESYARHRSAPTHYQPLFERDAHFAGLHPTELLLTVGPLNIDPPSVPTLSGSAA